MTNRYLGEFIAHGKTFCYSTQFKNKKYTKDEVLEVYELIHELVAENLRFISHQMRENDYTNGYTEYSIISMCFFSGFVKKYIVSHLKSKLAFSKIFDNAIDEFLQNPEQNVLWDFADHDRKAYLFNQIVEIKKRLVKQIDRLILHRLIANINYDIVVVINHFEKEFLYNLPNNVVGFVCRHYDNHDLTLELSYAYEIPIVATSKTVFNSNHVLIDGYNKRVYLDPKETIVRKALEINEKIVFNPNDTPKYKSDVIKFYANIVDKRGIDKAKLSNWYAGVASFRTEFMYITKGCIPSKEEQVELYVHLLEAFKDRMVHIRIPDLNDVKKLDYEFDVYTEVDYAKSFHRIFQDNVLAIAEASKITNKKVTLIIPRLRMGNEVERWRNQIEAYVGYNYPDEIKPNFGIMMETESAFLFYEDYKCVDAVIFGLNDFIEEALDVSRYDKLDIDSFKGIAWDDLKWTHQYFRRNGIKQFHIVSGNILKQKEILNRFINSGFKHFTIPLSYIKIAEEVLYEHESTRGAYVGVYAKREKAKLNQ